MNDTRVAALISAVWPHIRQDELAHGNYYDRLAEFITSQLSTASFSSRQAFGDEHLVSVIAGLRRIRPGQFTRNAATQVLSQGPLKLDEQSVQRHLVLALRIMLTLNIRSGVSKNRLQTQHKMIYPGPTLWEEETCLSKALAQHFSSLPSSPLGDMKSKKIEPNMTMAFLSSNRGVKVRWTSNLSEHLSMDWKSRVISVYEHKICLWNYLNASRPCIIPQTILGEAVDTLNLLFPLNDAPTKAFLRQQRIHFYGLGNCGRERCYELAKYEVWRERLANLVDVMSEEPRGTQQLALSKDGKHLLNFATFWVASAVALLTIISIALGTVQTIYSFKQYSLAVARACSAPDAATSLPRYCPKYCS
ncbi:hypothetical protein QBC42DRAFT_293602 [Cladorrhinum samala]|uniref:Uncharacterized protein n=1 Tax=Cladorrhinum samala TaxID=585594 RepID=A0AAV9HZG3_9PEZI|nr:hypothetical protein QBC42DRAFT_293602 [Cladorrhinum samala]